MIWDLLLYYKDERSPKILIFPISGHLVLEPVAQVAAHRPLVPQAQVLVKLRGSRHLITITGIFQDHLIVLVLVISFWIKMKSPRLILIHHSHHPLFRTPLWKKKYLLTHLRQTSERIVAFPLHFGELEVALLADERAPVRPSRVVAGAHPPRPLRPDAKATGSEIGGEGDLEWESRSGPEGRRRPEAAGDGRKQPLKA